jgi:hypothetical protein
LSAPSEPAEKAAENAGAPPPASPGSDDRRLVKLARVPIAFVAGAATLTVTLFQVHDRIWPPETVRGGEVVSVDLVEVGVSYARYVDDHPLLYPDRKSTLTKAGNIVVKNGAVVNVVIRMQGLRGRHCRAMYTVYRTPLEPVIGPEKALEDCTLRVQDGEQGGWAAWVELPQYIYSARNPRPVAHRYFIRFDLFDDDGRLIGPSKRSQVFGWDGERMTQ